MNIMMICEGLSGIIFYIFYFISNGTYQSQATIFINNIKGLDWSLISFILLILLLIIFTGFRTAYRVLTNKYYSPMSIALFEYIFEPLRFYIIQRLLKLKIKLKNLGSIFL